MSQPLDSQAKPGTVAGDHRPQGVNFPFLPHSLIGRILPREPEPSPPPTAFQVPVPRGLPCGPWLSQEFTTCTTDSDNQNTSLQGNSQRKPWHEQGNGVSTDRGGALFSIVKRNPCSLGRGQRSKASNDRVGYQKGTTGSTNGSEIHGSRFSNRTINNESSANYDCTNKMHAMRKQRYECLQNFTLQNRQRQATWRTQPNAQRSPLLDSTDKLRVKRDWFAVTKKKYEKRTLEAQKSNADEVKIDCSLQNGFSNETDQNDRCLQEQTEEHVDRDKIMPAADIRSNVDESLVDFATDVVEGNSSKAEVRNKKEMEDFSFEICSTTEVEVLAQEFADSFMLKDQHFNNNACAGFDSVRRSQVSCSSRRIFGSSIQCRPDIENLTPGFLSFFRSLVLPAEQAKGYQNILLHSLAMLVREEWPNVELHLYGSCANSFSLPSSDIDVCLSFDDTNVNKLQILFKLEKKLRSKNFQDVETLASARVPIVKMIDPESGISCDFCINNHLAVANTKLLRDYAMIDKRLQQLVFIVKHWAKSRGVNATFQGTLSSYAYVLMCIHFLQLRKPAILPCLQEMEATYLLTVDDIECAFFDNVETLRGFGSRNHESLAQLVWEFFHYWAYIHDYENHVISVRTGRIISKESKNWSKRSGNCRHLLCIEDPFETSHDLGRPVNMHTINILREEFKRAAVILQHDPYPLQNLFF